LPSAATGGANPLLDAGSAVPNRRLSRRALLACGTAAVAAGFAPRATTGARAQQAFGRILFARNGDVWVLERGAARLFFADGAATDPRWSPRGDGVLFVREADGYSDLLVHWLASSAGLPATALTANAPAYEAGSVEYVETGSWVQDPSWSDANAIAFASDRGPREAGMALWLMPAPGTEPYLAPIGEGAPAEVEAVSLATSGALAAYTARADEGEGTAVHLRDLGNGTVFVVADGAFDPAIAPDDVRVAFARREPGAGHDLWLFDRATGLERRLTQQGDAFAPAWSPDGTQLAYLRPDDGRFGIWAVSTADRAGELPEPWGLGVFDGLDSTGKLSWGR